MFFVTFWTWLHAQLATYVGDKTASVAAAIAPAVLTLAGCSVLWWGYLCYTGKVQEYILDTFKRLVFVGVILGVSIGLWGYHTVIVDTFVEAPIQLAAHIVGAGSPVDTINTIWNRGGYVASQLWNRGSVLNGDVGFYLAAGFVYFMIGAVAVYAMFLLALSQIAISAILVLGPLFIALLFFEATRRFFESWIAMLANYALISLLTVLVSALLLQIVQSYATQTAERGAAIVTVDALNMVLISALTLLILRQVPSMAAGLASGVALSSFGAVSGLMQWGLGTFKRTGYEFGRGVMDGWNREPISRWDSLRRGAGNLAGRGMANLRDQASGANRRGGTLVPRERYMPPRKPFK